MNNIGIISFDELNGSYLKRLLPFFGISIGLHILMIAIAVGLSFLFTGGRGLDVRIFNPGNPESLIASQPLPGGFEAPERMKIFRIDFFRQIIPWTPPPPETIPEEVTPVVPEEEIIPEVIEEETPEEEEIPEETETTPEEVVPELQPEETPVEETVQQSTTESELPIPENPGFTPFRKPDRPDNRSWLIDNQTGTEGRYNFESDLFPSGANAEPGVSPLLSQPSLSGNIEDLGSAPDALGIFSDEDIANTGGNVFVMPDWQLPDPDGNTWIRDQFLGNYTIYLVGDVSRRHGEEDLLAWNWVLRQLITNPHAAYPPNFVTVATAMVNPYGYDDERIFEILNTARETENLFGVPIADSEGKFPRSLGYAELPQPIIIFVDNYGFIRLIMIGRIRDISNDNIQAAMGTIADMWQWDPNETAQLPTMMILLINMLREQAYDPAQRQIPPPETAHQIAPTWGYPSVDPIQHPEASTPGSN